MKQIEIETTTDLQLSIQIAITHIEDSIAIRRTEDEIALCIYDNGNDIFNFATITKENACFLAYQLLELSK